MRNMFRWVKHRWMYVLGWTVGFLPLSFIVRVTGRKHLPRRGPFVIIANHETYMDPYLITGSLPLRLHLRWISKSALHNRRTMYRESETIARKKRKRHSLPVRLLLRAGLSFSVFFAKTTRMIIIRPGVSTTQRAVRVLRTTRDIVAIFPTGVRRSLDAAAPPRKGFVVIAREADVPVVPVVLQRRSAWRWRLRILPLIAPARLADDTFGSDDAQRAATIMARLYAVCGCSGSTDVDGDASL